MEFALAASGNVLFLGDGEQQEGVFRPASIFARVELPALRVMDVTRVVVLNVHRKGVGEHMIRLALGE